MRFEETEVALMRAVSEKIGKPPGGFSFKSRSEGDARHSGLQPRERGYVGLSWDLSPSREFGGFSFIRADEINGIEEQMKGRRHTRVTNGAWRP